MTASTPERTGLVVAGFGRQVLIETTDSNRYRCRMMGRNIRPVCGDNVKWRPLKSDQVDGVVTAIIARKNVLERPNRRGKEEAVAANLDQLVVVFSPAPKADPFLIDRYIAAAEHMRIDCLLTYNKIDLASYTVPAWLSEFEELGYSVILTSAAEGTGVEQLREACTNRISILVGQSGVGKSSLLNAILPGVNQQTGALSDSGRFGRHTTSASYLFYLDELKHSAGALIDSPGVRDFAPPPLNEDQVATGFVEIFAAAAKCRFGNCRHEQEPNCEVKKQVEDGAISGRRYDSYCKMMNLMRTLGATR